MFASASEDGYVNIWDLRMGEFIKQLKVDNNEPISSIKFVCEGNKKHLIIAHSDKLSILSAKDNFNKRHTYSIGSQYKISKMEYNGLENNLYFALKQNRGMSNILSVWNIDFNN